MQAIFYNVTDSKNTIGKTLENGFITSLSLRKDFDPQKPILKVKVPTSDFFPYNYFTLPTLGKSYFIENSSFIGWNVYEIKASLDLLETYKDDILTAQATFSRSKQANLYGEVYNLSLSEQVLTFNHASNKELAQGNTTIFNLLGVK